MERDDPAGGGEHDVAAVRGGAADPHRDRLPDGVLHLRGDRAHPDQLVEPELLAGQAGLRGRLERLARRADRLVRLLGVLDLARVGAGRVGEVLGAVELAHLRPGRLDRAVGQRGRVGAHVGDEAVLVETLRHRHGHRGRHAELAARLLLERGGAERRVGRAAVGLGLHRADVVRRVAERVDQALGGGAVEVDPAALLLLEQAVVAEVGAARDPDVVDRVQLAREHPRVLGGPGVEGALEVPVGRDPERHPLALAVDDQPGRDGLHPAGGQAGHDLLPEDRADLVAVEAVEDAARLLGLDEVHVELARVLGGLEDRGLGDLVEDHPLDRDALLGLELVEQVPGDGLALAVLVGGEVELVGVLEQRLELGDVLLLVARHDVVGLEAVVDVDGQPAPGLVLDLGRGLGGALREVADVADGGLDDVALAEVPADLAGLRRGLDDHQLVCHSCLSCVG